MPESTFDLEITTAWTAFGKRLSAYITAMVDNDSLVIESQYDSMDGLADAPACIRFFAWNKTKVRAEVPANLLLHPLRTLDPKDHEKLVALGFHRPDQCEHEDSGNGSMSFYIDSDRSKPEVLVSKALRILDEVWSIAHPSFLLARSSGREDIPAFTVGPQRIDAGNSLSILVDAALEQLLGHTPERDDDGDIPLVGGEQVTYVRVLGDDGYVEVFSRVVHSIADLDQAAVVLAQLNRQWPTLKLILVEQSVLGVVRVDGAPFVSEHLLRALRSLSDLSEVSDQLAAELGGQPIRVEDNTDPSLSDFEDAASDFDAHECHEFPPALMSILELGADVTGSLTPDEVAKICGHDRDTILEYLRISQEQEASWHQALTDAIGRGGDDVELCTGEKFAWTQTIQHLRRALRTVVLPENDGSAKQLGLFDEPI
ncbi:hypothetical protein [Rhodococcus sp. IEGM 1379]|uniref:T3SS (YopN, CesT) and YbjN peptide-binding chaperone 1 n=1 Tax=Rhodococcus sp. IEGM 1379 TaxID=3047086 RepID=UPI0024B7DE65|nr:hypothetical protein [Rhodococcus sp. IEGM 1379]MDI9915924.1 hypothetical protein [Rhodococcus sp. IEGM 1379]